MLQIRKHMTHEYVRELPLACSMEGLHIRGNSRTVICEAEEEDEPS